MASVVIGGLMVACSVILAHLFFEVERAKGLTRRILADTKSMDDFVVTLKSGGLFDKKSGDLDHIQEAWRAVLSSGGDWATIIDMELQSTKASYAIVQRIIGSILFILFILEGILLPIAFVVSAVLLCLIFFLPQGAPSWRRSMANLGNLVRIFYYYNAADPDGCKRFSERHKQFGNLHRSISQLTEVKARPNPLGNDDEGLEAAPSVITTSSWKRIVPAVGPGPLHDEAERLRVLADKLSGVMEGGAPGDGERVAEDIRDYFEGLDRRLASDNGRLLAIMRSISDRIGGPVIVCNPDGDVSIHPDLAAELDKPGNERLAVGCAEMLRIMSADARRRVGHE